MHIPFGKYRLEIKKSSSAPIAENVSTPLIGQSLYNAYNFESPSLDRNIRNGYEGNSLIAGAIAFWQFAFVQALFSIETGANEQVLQLLQNPNPEQSESDFKLSLITNVLVGGETFILGGKNNSKQVVQLWNYHAGLMQPLYDTNGFLKSYLYYNPNKPSARREYDIQDVIHLKWIARGAYNANKGTSPIAQVFRDLNLDNEIGRSVYSYLKADMLRGKIVRVSAEADPPTLKERMEMKQAWLEQTTGENKGFPVFMQKIEKPDSINGTFDELNTENIAAESEARIATAFGISPILLEWCVGLKRTSENNVREADKRFNTRKFSPLLQMFGETLTHGFKNRFGFNGNYSIGFDKTKMETFQELQRERESYYVDQYTKNAITFDELRDAIGRPKVPESAVANELRSTANGAKQFVELIKLYGTVPNQTLISIAVNTFGYPQAEATAMFPEKQVEDNPPVSNLQVTSTGVQEGVT